MTEPKSSPDSAVAEAFLLDLAHALHRYGLPAYRMEDSLLRVAAKLGVELQVFTLPTGLQLAFGPLATQRMRLMRVQPAGVHLSRVAELADLIEDLVGGVLDVCEATARLRDIGAARQPHGNVTNALAYALASACSAVFFGAHFADVVASLLIGLLVGLLAGTATRSDRLARMFDVAAAAGAAFLAGLVAHLPYAVTREIVALSALIVLIPGYTLTVALNELTARHLASGTARLGGAFVTFLLLGCGMAIGFVGADACAPLVESLGLAMHAPLVLPPVALWIALAVAPLAFKVLFQARHRDTPYIEAACWIAFVGARLGAGWLGPNLGAGLGTFILGVASNLFARRRRQSATVTLVPGLLILVPGSLGFRGVASFLQLDALSGIDMVFRMFTIAMALVAGLVLANVVLPSRKSL